MKYLFIIPSLSIKYNLHRCKPADPPLVASEVRQMFHVILTIASRLNICL